MLIASIKKTAKMTGIPEHILRKMLKANQLPGFFSGTWFYVDVEKLESVIRSEVDPSTGKYQYLRVPSK